MKKPYFSIVTPTLNIAHFLPRMLKSVETQTFRDYEHIFIDGYSSDGTWEMIQDYKKRHKDINITAVQKRAKGVFVGDMVSEIISDIAGRVNVGETGVSVPSALQPVSNKKIPIRNRLRLFLFMLRPSWDVKCKWILLKNQFVDRLVQYLFDPYG